MFESGESEPGGSRSAGPIPLDLVDPAIYAPKLRRVAVLAALVGVAVAGLAALFLSWPVAVLIGLVVGGPTAGYAVVVARRRIWLSGTEVHARQFLRTRRIDLARLDRAELITHPGRIGRVLLSIGAGQRGQIVPLAMYTDEGAGRELDVRALRGLADGLAHSELAAGAAVSSVLLRQLQAEARDAPLGERPLFRAFRMLRDNPEAGHLTLTDSEVAALID
ncbi:hypothetical protein [Skermania piniformis]|uniref:PH domain-containing protein n=1 Tax=Skermania pinensis TaxID=39122 RepID=A0ABX8SE46_9ACTN|nr:hypothetical protein [Skermania piniformis]QXQ15432.1 hypothetical protein KV203_09075 [Skermania piniformis]